MTKETKETPEVKVFKTPEDEKKEEWRKMIAEQVQIQVEQWAAYYQQMMAEFTRKVTEAVNEPIKVKLYRCDGADDYSVTLNVREVTEKTHKKLLEIMNVLAHKTR